MAARRASSSIISSRCIRRILCRQEEPRPPVNAGEVEGAAGIRGEVRGRGVRRLVARRHAPLPALDQLGALLRGSALRRCPSCACSMRRDVDVAKLHLLDAQLLELRAIDGRRSQQFERLSPRLHVALAVLLQVVRQALQDGRRCARAAPAWHRYRPACRPPRVDALGRDSGVHVAHSAQAIGPAARPVAMPAESHGAGLRMPMCGQCTDGGQCGHAEAENGPAPLAIGRRRGLRGRVGIGSVIAWLPVFITIGLVIAL